MPLAALAVKLADEPGQTVVPLAAGATGVELTVTVTGTRALEQLLFKDCT